MGPSGCGKSTLLSVLMGNADYGRHQGQIWINGRELRVSRLRRITGYVPQVLTSRPSPRPPCLASGIEPPVHVERQTGDGRSTSLACKTADYA